MSNQPPSGGNTGRTSQGLPSDLPPHAQERLAEIRSSGTWGSALTSEEFMAIRSVGFEAAGQVLGAAVYNLGFTGGYSCPGPWGGGYGYGYGSAGLPARTQVSSRGGGYSYGSFAPLVQTMYEARRTAIKRMVEECSALGGHGVVGVRLTIGAFPSGGLEFKAIGTAVRAAGVPLLRHPFTSDLTGQDFAKLITKGWVPAGLVLGISIGARHDDWTTRAQTRWGAGNAEVSGYTELVNDTRHDARQELAKDVRRLGAEGVVIADMDLRVSERECPVSEGTRDHIVESTTIGTAITRFSRTAEAHGHPALAIMSLDPQRRQAARTNIGANRL
ncbi:MAG TPA: heavy metal-binding domain-containing protein [Trebonia sp.]|nr:heavy metal-binding domain-containing protein [Trebonia sp.]